MGKSGENALNTILIRARPEYFRGLEMGIRKERERCAEIALDIWKKKRIKYIEKYKMVGREIAAEILLKSEEEE